MADFAGLRNGVLATFGERIVVSVDSVELPIERAAWLEPYVGMNLGGAEINRPNPSVRVAATEWDATGAVHGSYVFRNATPTDPGTRYAVVDVGPADAAGMRVVTLRGAP